MYAIDEHGQQTHMMSVIGHASTQCYTQIDWNYDEDRSRISKGNGPDNMTRLRRFAVGVIKMFAKGKMFVTEKMQQLNRNIRLVFDYLRMTENSTRGVLSRL